MPNLKSVSDIKSSLLRPALTSHYYVEIGLPSSGQGGDSNFRSYLTANGIQLNNVSQEKLNLSCCEATLPGSTVATFEVNNDRTGVTERHAHRKFFDDRIDLTFYVDVEQYLPIKFFETWIKFVVNEKQQQDTVRGVGSLSPTYFYRMNYPDEYTTEGLTITKFEKDTYSRNGTGNVLQYKFVRAFPISITSMPISYESASLLKCTVSMTYVRYVLNIESRSNSSFEGTDSNKFNPNLQLNLGIDYDKFTSTGGISNPFSQASGNTISFQDAMGISLK